MRELCRLSIIDAAQRAAIHTSRYEWRLVADTVEKVKKTNDLRNLAKGCIQSHRLLHAASADFQ
jgi:hypothetical protein